MAMMLKSGPFANNLCMKPLTTMNKLRLGAANYIRVEEMRELRNNLRTETAQTKK